MLRVILAVVFGAGLQFQAEGVDAQTPASAKITGTVTYLQRSALPPDAVLIVRLEDVSRAGAPALVLGENTIAFAGRQVPIPFEVAYNPAAVVANHQYSVRAMIKVADHMVFASTQSYPVLTRGAPTNIAITVIPLPTQAPNTALEGTHWKLVELGGKPVVAQAGAKQAYLSLERSDHRLAGSTGCNALVGTYKLKRGKLTIEPAATTTACIDALARQESALLDAYRSVNRYRVDHNMLELRHGKDVLARFEAQYKP